MSGHSTTSKWAFSLIELSIVLVILGLLVGGVLSGRSLIHAAEMRSVVADYQRFVGAGQAFRDKYFALPGDITNATVFWGTASGGCPTGARSGTQTCNGNGDGQISNTDVGGATNFEQFTLWQHLANAGLIEGTYTGLSSTAATDDVNHTAGTNCPKAKIGNTGWSVYWLGQQDTAVSFHHWSLDYGNHMIVGGKYSNRHYAAVGFKPEDAWNIDVKLDDGKPAYGKVVSLKGGSSITPNCATTAVNTTAAYNLSLSSAECSIGFTRVW